ncbi:MAG TPA: murein biosynthesis integral membrane protein MurJ [Zoogloea sp.]|uniref:murein biosynthesis integral membrane protein MurJ n=1 Tax=Zoogloea sp. TaxID=49181 RepID=UPI002BF208CE|nr:murein biosynthesis integral membrane protein MurJ [Zoogloea sp.]HMV16944.1 murein biosynthesis integral membrane protein MurJ [Rhodocyclaceae bacterium]HMV62114.1 murein biosynthesis integral membrane protein MurJ [Rhodocyclaceae bacterium]HMW51882.1 murein biosynthesis integral membrane protein MurJ [Rhodocyclaceae bacterium]HMY49032.1 murein biosynthesis integral membrane protein MurJ [Rhodocyclaceae bacterium]HMZ75944.1 murein biosynthesis integral membrane protein MurJ [Rhodocyclaceae 
MNLLRALATVSGMTLLSRILGFIRDFVVARAFGAGLATDAFFVAFRLPNLLRRMFAEGAFSQAFVPILAEYKNRRGPDETRTLVDHVASALGVVVLIVSILGALGAPAIIYATAPGFSSDAEKFDLTVQLTRITFPYIFFMALVALSGGILNTWSRFAIPAFTPVLLNLSFIGMALFAAPYFDPPVVALGWAVFIGGLAQVLLQIRPLARIGMLPRFSLSFADPGVRRILKLMAPAILGVSVSQISLLINTVFASFLPSGSVSWLYYADRLMEFPAGLLGVALGTILLPSLSKMHADDNRSEFSALLDWGLRLTLMLTLPSALALALLAVPLVTTLFFHGAFKVADVYATRSALMAYSAGLAGLILVKVLAPAFYARQDIRTPVRIALITLAATQLMNLAFVGVFRHAGLALSIGLASCINAGLLFRGLRLRGIYLPQPGWRAFFLKLLAALTVLGGGLWLTMGADELWLTASGLDRVTRLTALVIGGIIIYFATLFALGFRVSDFHRRGAT